MENNVQQSVSADRAIEMWRESVLSLTTKYESAPEVLSVSGIPIATLGNFSASIGKAKSKKTFNVSAMVAAALTDEPVMGYQVQLPADKNKVLYIDTEQSRDHCQRVMKRIMQLANLSTEVDDSRIQFLSLRKYNPEDRMAIAEVAISRSSGVGLVIIDGIRDMLYDINSPSEATNTVTKLMKWTDEYRLHIHTIIHQNKSDENARGHIGTEVNNKAETVIQVEKDKDNPDRSIVTPVHCRSQEFTPFAFVINQETCLPELDFEWKAEEKGKAGRPKRKEKNFALDYTAEQHRQALDLAFPKGESIKGYGNVCKALIEAYGVADIELNQPESIQLMTFLSHKRMIHQKKGRGIYTYDPTFKW